MGYKLKTKKAAAKRLTVTSTGKVRHSKAGKRHLLRNQSTKAKRNKRGLFEVAASDIKKVRQLLPGL